MATTTEAERDDLRAWFVEHMGPARSENMWRLLVPYEADRPTTAAERDDVFAWWAETIGPRAAATLREMMRAT